MAVVWPLLVVMTSSLVGVQCHNGGAARFVPPRFSRREVPLFHRDTNLQIAQPSVRLRTGTAAT
jgi:hypothetical protein